MSNLIEALVSIAANWRICECGLHIGRDGVDGWNQTHQRLEEELSRLQQDIGLLEKWIADTNGKLRLKKKSELAGLEVKRVETKAKTDSITSEWEKAIDETEACHRLFQDALNYCVLRAGIGHDEIFHAALVGFDASQLKAGHQPSKRRLPEIASLLMNLQRGLPNDEWETKEWAKPVRISMRQKRRVAPEMLKAFNAKAIETHCPKVEATADGSKPQKKKAGKKRAIADKINEACEVWIAYEREGKGAEDFCVWRNGDKKVGCITTKWLNAKLTWVRKLIKEDRIPTEFKNKLKPLRRVKSVPKKTVKNSRRSS